jgi:hypothetical protein
MKKPISVSFLSFVMLGLCTSVTGQNWTAITPMKSTRPDVETILGPAQKSLEVIYELESGNVFIEYSSGPCRADRKGGWNIRAETVISFRFSPKVKQDVSDLRIDRNKFKKVADRHSGGYGYYLINDRDGIMYEVQQGEVGYVEYYPPSKYDRLQCGRSPTAAVSKKKH